MGIDATTKVPPETDHQWGDELKSDPDVAAMVEIRLLDFCFLSSSLSVM